MRRDSAHRPPGRRRSGFKALRAKGAQHPIEAKGKELRSLMSWIKDNDSDYVEGSAAS